VGSGDVQEEKAEEQAHQTKMHVDLWCQDFHRRIDTGLAHCYKLYEEMSELDLDVAELNFCPDVGPMSLGNAAEELFEFDLDVAELDFYLGVGPVSLGDEAKQLTEFDLDVDELSFCPGVGPMSLGEEASDLSEFNLDVAELNFCPDVGPMSLEEKSGGGCQGAICTVSRGPLLIGVAVVFLCSCTALPVLKRCTRPR